MLEVEPNGPRVRNVNKAVAGATSEAFATWLCHRYASVATAISERHIVSPHDILFYLKVL